ncbi:protealysin inhibitor emfourin [Actinoplanes sp. NPDC026619]|uniref:protealysin inhibitor emfourin n=1 Tax=Actinoplanes sp. NPDC026619 TaxID=3155798 RepID=UPI0033CF14D7
MTDRVRVELRRSGGFAGLSVHKVLDSAQMPPAEAASLVRIVGALDFGALRSTGPVHGADLMHYALTIERGEARWQGAVSDPSIPAALQPLLDFLNGHSFR